MGTLTVVPEPSNGAALVDQARTTFLTGGGRHPVLIDLPRAMADSERIVQVLGNLLSNAARHSPPSSRSRSRPSRAPGRGRAKTPILVVADDPETLRYVRGALSDAGYAPLVAGDPEELFRVIRSERPSLVLLDLILPGTDGIELMQQVPELAHVPAIFISAYGRDETIAKALESGAADYIVKPFSSTELVARVQAALRDRSEPETFVLGDLTIDYGPRRASLAGRVVSLTATEFDLLRVLSLDAGHVVTTSVLLRQVWGRRHADNAAKPTYTTSTASASACRTRTSGRRRCSLGGEEGPRPSRALQHSRRAFQWPYGPGPEAFAGRRR